MAEQSSSQHTVLSASAPDDGVTAKPVLTRDEASMDALLAKTTEAIERKLEDDARAGAKRRRGKPRDRRRAPTAAEDATGIQAMALTYCAGKKALLSKSIDVLRSGPGGGGDTPAASVALPAERRVELLKPLARGAVATSGY